MSQSPMNLQGAIDLGAVAAAREAQAKAIQAAADRAANPVASKLVIDVTTASFEQDVLQQSLTVPVVVDLWATWCEPCKQLSPILESLVAEYDGRWILAKVDVDAEQQIAAAFQVQSIPSVFVVIGGQVAPMFQGAMPEPQIRQVLDAVLLEAQKAGISGSVNGNETPSSEVPEIPSDPRFDAAESAIEAGDWESAIAAYRVILAATPGDSIAKIGLLNSVIVGGAQAPAVFLVEQADTYVVETALKAQESFRRQPPQRIAAPVGDVVAGQETFVVLLDPVSIDRVIQKQAKI